MVTGQDLANSKEAERIGKVLQEHPKVADRLIDGFIGDDLSRASHIANKGRTSRKEIRGEVQEKNAARLRAAAKKILDDPKPPFEIITGDFRKVLKNYEADSVDVLLTDFPFYFDNTDLAKPLAVHAKRILKKDCGVLAVMLGVCTFDKFFVPLCKNIGKKFPFRGVIAYLMPAGKTPQVFTKAWNPTWNPVCVFGKNTEFVHCDVIQSEPIDKWYQKEQQDVGGFKKLMELLIHPVKVKDNKLPNPGKRCLDITCGTGTSLIAAMFASSGPHYMTGIEIDPVRAETARSRCKVAWDLLKQCEGDGDRALEALKLYEKNLAEKERLKEAA